VVTSSAGKAALNFSREAHMEHDLRYEVAQEFVDVVKGLWDCWQDGAIVADKATGVYIDASKVHPLGLPWRAGRLRRPGRAGASGARVVSARVRGDDAA